MKLLFCSFDSPGHLFPLAGLALELRGRGHQVAFATGLPAAPVLQAEGMERIPRDVEDGPSFRVNVHHQPLSIAVDVKHVEHAVARFAPDAIVTHQLAHGPLLVRERTEIPVAVVGLFSYLWSWSHRAAASADLPELERTRRWRIGSDLSIVNEARKLFRMPPLTADGPDLPFLGDLFMLRSIPELVPELGELPSRVHAVGACLWEPRQDERDAWSAFHAQLTLPEAPLLYVQHGRTFGGPGFWSPLTEALADQPVQVVATVGRMDQEVGVIPPNFTVFDHIPQGFVLPHARAVVSGGHTSAVLGALTHGLPSVLIPAGGETPDNAYRVAAAGCGIRIGEERLSAETVRKTVWAVLEEPGLLPCCRRVRRAFAETPPFHRAADLVEQLVVTGAPVHRDAETEVLAVT